MWVQGLKTCLAGLEERLRRLKVRRKGSANDCGSSPGPGPGETDTSAG